MKKVWIIAASILFLGIYLNFDTLRSSVDQDIMEVEVLPMEEILAMCEGKEDAFLTPQITLNEGSIAYDHEQKMLIIQKNMS